MLLDTCIAAVLNFNNSSVSCCNCVFSAPAGSIRVFWVGPLLGGVLGTVVWEAVLRPDQPVEEETKTIVQAATV